MFLKWIEWDLVHNSRLTRLDGMAEGSDQAVTCTQLDIFSIKLMVAG